MWQFYENKGWDWKTVGMLLAAIDSMFLPPNGLMCNMCLFQMFTFHPQNLYAINSYISFRLIPRQRFENSSEISSAVTPDYACPFDGKKHQ
jgi:hypothetical protein